MMYDCSTTKEPSGFPLDGLKMDFGRQSGSNVTVLQDVRLRKKLFRNPLDFLHSSTGFRSHRKRYETEGKTLDGLWMALLSFQDDSIR